MQSKNKLKIVIVTALWETNSYTFPSQVVTVVMFVYTDDFGFEDSHATQRYLQNSVPSRCPEGQSIGAILYFNEVGSCVYYFAFLILVISADDLYIYTYFLFPSLQSSLVIID